MSQDDELTIERLDARKIQFPTQMLTIHLAKVSHEESVFVSGIAGFVVDGFDALPQSVADQSLRQSLAISTISSIIGPIIVLKEHLGCFLYKDIVIKVVSWCQVIDEGCCHNHILRSGCGELGRNGVSVGGEAMCRRQWAEPVRQRLFP